MVDEIGDDVTGFGVGDEVYGDNLALMGGFAEYALAPESVLIRKPAGLTFAEASTIPQAGAIALQGTRKAVAGSRVLINGAGGGSGSFAIQLAKRLGAHVTGVDNAAKQDFMRSVGADEVVDYGREDFTRATPAYDLILDLVAHRSVFAYRRALARGGTYRCVGGTVRSLLRVLTAGSVTGLVTGRSIGVLVVREGPAHFKPLADLCVSGEVDIHVDRVFALDEVPAALARVGEGRALGKVVVAPPSPGLDSGRNGWSMEGAGEGWWSHGIPEPAGCAGGDHGPGADRGLHLRSGGRRAGGVDLGVGQAAWRQQEEMPGPAGRVRRPAA